MSLEQVLLSVALGLVLLGFLASGLWVALSLMAVAVLALELFSTAPIGRVMATRIWGASSSWALTALPLFIWMGEILFRTRLAEDMFKGLGPWMTRLPGRLLHVNILGCAFFAAVSGSSAATAATIGRMTLPELQKRGYDENLSIGTLAGSATLGLLIPPSIILIVYGVSAEVSIARLFIAGILPGLMLVLLFMGYVAAWALIYPDKVPPAGEVVRVLQRLAGSWRLLPVIGLIVFVIGSIYAGIATATEAAAFGVAGALVLSALTGQLTWKSFTDSLMGAMVTSCMIAFILAGAAFLTVAMGFAGIPRELARWIAVMDLSPAMLLTALTVLFILLGCFLDGISVVVLTTAVILPVVQAVGIDLIWFGIYVVLVVEMSQITPPVGFNLFVIQALTGRNILQVAYAALPFFFLLLVGVVLITVFPEIVTWLPGQMGRR
jgi:C4-dicarboxylate transporter, DctM subunit